MGLVDMPFQIANVRCENPDVAAHTRIGWFRSVSNIPHGFAVQSMVGELAHLTGRDQKDMLLQLIGEPRIVKLNDSVKDFWNYGEPLDSYPIDAGRLRRVVELVAEKGGWGRPVPKGLKQTKQKWPAQSYATMICTNGQRAIRSAKETILELPGRQLDDGCGTVLGRSR